MGLFDNAMNMLNTGGQQQQDQEPKAQLLQAAMALLASNGAQGLLQKFQDAGLGHVVNSWIGTGQNLPISGEQVQQVLGDDHLQQVSEQTGMPPQEAANHLSDLLPGLIDKLTPNGELPQGGLSQVSGLLGQLFGKH